MLFSFLHRGLRLLVDRSARAAPTRSSSTTTAQQWSSAFSLAFLFLIPCRLPVSSYKFPSGPYLMDDGARELPPVRPPPGDAEDRWTVVHHGCRRGDGNAITPNAVMPTGYVDSSTRKSAALGGRSSIDHLFFSHDQPATAIIWGASFYIKDS